jgi:hypothetical protein
LDLRVFGCPGCDDGQMEGILESNLIPIHGLIKFHIGKGACGGEKAQRKSGGQLATSPFHSRASVSSAETSTTANSSHLASSSPTGARHPAYRASRLA